MLRWASWLGMALMALCLVGCGATGPRYSEMAKNLPALKEDQGRVFFYRNSVLGAAVQPDVRIGGAVVGTSQPNSFFYVDRPAGIYQASARTEVENTISLKVQPQKEIFVQMGIQMGLFVGHPTFSQVTESQGKGDMQTLAYGGLAPASAVTASAGAPKPAAAPTAPVAVPASTTPPTSTAPATSSGAAAPQAAASPGPVAISNEAKKPEPPKATGPFAKTSMNDLQLLLPAAK
jgi:hypothetical protein